MDPQKYCISLELAKRLHKLGLKKKSIFLWQTWTCPQTGKRRKQIVNMRTFGDAYPAYTSGELGEMLPVRNYILDRPKDDLANWETYKSDGKWHCSLHWRYSRLKLEYIEAETEAEARGLMLEYLINNKLHNV